DAHLIRPDVVVLGRRGLVLEVNGFHRDGDRARRFLIHGASSGDPVPAAGRRLARCRAPLVQLSSRDSFWPSFPMRQDGANPLKTDQNSVTPAARGEAMGYTPGVARDFIPGSAPDAPVLGGDAPVLVCGGPCSNLEATSALLAAAAARSIP